MFVQISRWSSISLSIVYIISAIYTFIYVHTYMYIWNTHSARCSRVALSFSYNTVEYLRVLFWVSLCVYTYECCKHDPYTYEYVFENAATIHINKHIYTNIYNIYMYIEYVSNRKTYSTETTHRPYFGIIFSVFAYAFCDGWWWYGGMVLVIWCDIVRTKWQGCWLCYRRMVRIIAAVVTTTTKTTTKHVYCIYIENRDDVQACISVGILYWCFVQIPEFPRASCSTDC